MFFWPFPCLVVLTGSRARAGGGGHLVVEAIKKRTHNAIFGEIV